MVQARPIGPQRLRGLRRRRVGKVLDGCRTKDDVAADWQAGEFLFGFIPLPPLSFHLRRLACRASAAPCELDRPTLAMGAALANFTLVPAAKPGPAPQDMLASVSGERARRDVSRQVSTASVPALSFPARAFLRYCSGDIPLQRLKASVKGGVDE